MIKMYEKHKEINIACSGGVDSMVVVDFLSRYSQTPVNLFYFNHGSKHGYQAEEFLKDFVGKSKRNLTLTTASIIDWVSHTLENTSQEAIWRDARYSWFHSMPEKNIMTCHHLDDCVETFLFTSIRHGEGKIIPYENKNVYRPFLETRKKTFKRWAETKGVPYIEDPSNSSTKYDRNYIRHVMMPHVLRINPGIAKVVAKKVLKQYENNKLKRKQK